jgi:glycosyltransferase involved in cell wall biosynthesis
VEKGGTLKSGYSKLFCYFKVNFLDFAGIRNYAMTKISGDWILFVDADERVLESLKQEITRTNDRVETYQKASQQVVNLAFSLILAATAAIVISVVLGRR